MPDANTNNSLSWSLPVVVPDSATGLTATACSATLQSYCDLTVVKDAYNKESCYYMGKPLNSALPKASVVEATRLRYKDLGPLLEEERRKLGPKPDFSQQASGDGTDADVWTAKNTILTPIEAFADKFKHIYESNLHTRFMPLAKLRAEDCNWRELARDFMHAQQEPTKENQTAASSIPGSSHGQQ